MSAVAASSAVAVIAWGRRCPTIHSLLVRWSPRSAISETRAGPSYRDRYIRTEQSPKMTGRGAATSCWAKSIPVGCPRPIGAGWGQCSVAPMRSCGAVHMDGAKQSCGRAVAGEARSARQGEPPRDCQRTISRSPSAAGSQASTTPTPLRASRGRICPSSPIRIEPRRLSSNDPVGRVPPLTTIADSALRILAAS